MLAAYADIGKPFAVNTFPGPLSRAALACRGFGMLGARLPSRRANDRDRAGGFGGNLGRNAAQQLAQQRILPRADQDLIDGVLAGISENGIRRIDSLRRRLGGCGSRQSLRRMPRMLSLSPNGRRPVEKK